MQKRSMLIRAANWQSPYLYDFAVFKIEILDAIFKGYLHENEALHTPTFYIKMNHFGIIYSYDLRRMATYVFLEVWFFQVVRFTGVRFFSDPGLGSGSDFQNDAHRFYLCLFHKTAQISESKHFNRSKASSYFFRGG